MSASNGDNGTSSIFNNPPNSKPQPSRIPILTSPMAPSFNDSKGQPLNTCAPGPPPDTSTVATFSTTTAESATSHEKPEQLAVELQHCSWDQLQDRFMQTMDERSEFESALQKETAELLEVFIVWSQTSGFHDEDRAYKRLKTRVDYVQNCEANLEDKKRHYTNVVKAFESALAMLRDV